MIIRKSILSGFTNVLFIAMNCMYEIDCNTSSCTRAPVITGYSRPHGVLVSVYNLTWQSLSCHLGGIVQYQIEYVGNCSTTPILFLSTGSNKTYAVISFQYCTDGGCYFRVRAELRDGSFTEYSPCVLVSNLLLPHETHIQWYYQDVCVPVEGTCDIGVLPEFTINGRWTMWPLPGNPQYNVTYSQALRTFNFCYKNITHDIMLSAYCYQLHTSGCSICSLESSEIVFISFSNIFLQMNGDEPAITPTPSFAESDDNRRATDIEIGLDLSMFKIVTSKSIHTVVQETYSIASSLVDRTPFLNSNMTETKSLLLTHFVGIISGSAITLLLLGVGLIVISVAIWCYKKGKLRQDTDTIYDEPSLPDPVYQELNVLTASDTHVEMIANDCYQIAANISASS